MNLEELDTPSLVIDLDRMERNLTAMQKMADSAGVKLRPHTKTHKMAEVARLQLDYGAKGVTVAKVSEAEAMVKAGISDIFIATEIVGNQKLARVAEIAKRANIRMAVDSIYHVRQIADFVGKQFPMKIMIEVDTGMHRCGVEPDEAVSLVGDIIEEFPQVKLAGVFTHEGHTYNARDKKHMRQIAIDAQVAVVDIGKRIMNLWGIPCEISVGCTLGQLAGEVVDGITEIRPGTYVFYDVGHAYFLGDSKFCAVSILSTVTSKNNEDQVVADAGAKSMTIDQRSSGVLKTNGFGFIKGHSELLVKKLSDEHAVITPGSSLNVGDRIEIIPNHVCPTVNLYDRAYGVRDGKVEKIFQVTARGCVQ
ncbi:MAG TPA: alanine racemase [Bacillales bacterium]|nr:alanine racemase [Bacillales bacterium]